MAYDRDLADRIRAALSTRTDVTEKAMFGGLAFLVDGHMAIAASSRGQVLARIDPADGPALLEQPGVAPMVMRGRPMKGWLEVTLGPDDDVVPWIDRGLATIPPVNAD